MAIVKLNKFGKVWVSMVSYLVILMMILRAMWCSATFQRPWRRQEPLLLSGIPSK